MRSPTHARRLLSSDQSKADASAGTASCHPFLLISAAQVNTENLQRRQLCKGSVVRAATSKGTKIAADTQQRKKRGGCDSGRQLFYLLMPGVSCKRSL